MANIALPYRYSQKEGTDITNVWETAIPKTGAGLSTLLHKKTSSQRHWLAIGA